MALVRLGPIVQAISGTTGAVTFVRKGPRTVARRRQGFRLKTSAAVLERQSRMITIRHRWGILTTLQRDAWATYGRTILRRNRLGTLTALTAYQAYIQYHLAQIVWPIVWESDPPPLARPKSPESLTLAFTCDGPYTLTITPAGWIASDHLQIFLARSHAYGPLRVLKYYRYIKSLALYPLQTTNLYPATLPILGDLTAGEHIHCRVRVYRYGGGPGPPLTETTTVQCP